MRLLLWLLIPGVLCGASALEKAMAGHSGTAVGLDVKSGKVLAAHRLYVASRTPARTLAGGQLQALGAWNVRRTPLEILADYRKLALMPLLAGLEGAATYGTARLARPDGLRVAGKPGTAGHAWFAGFAPADAPRIPVVVFLATGSGGGDSAPLARAIFAASLA